MLRNIIVDILSGSSAKVDEDRAILVKAIPIPTVSTRDDQLPLARFITLNGVDTGTSNMNVNGSVTPVEFHVPSSSNGDRYITNIGFQISGTSINDVILKNFGSIAPLTNGVRIFYETEQGRVEFQKGQPIRSNFEMIRLCLGSPSFGSGTDVFKAIAISGSGGTTLHGYFPVLDIRRVFGFQWGIRLRQSADQKIIIQVNDNLTAVSEFKAFVTGFDLAEIQ